MLYRLKSFYPSIGANLHHHVIYKIDVRRQLNFVQTKSGTLDLSLQRGKYKATMAGKSTSPPDFLPRIQPVLILVFVNLRNQGFSKRLYDTMLSLNLLLFSPFLKKSVNIIQKIFHCEFLLSISTKGLSRDT